MAVLAAGLVLLGRAAPDPDAVPAEDVRRQTACATAAVVGLLCAIGWPLRDAAEHGMATAAALSLVLLVVVVPPLLVAAVPPWAARRLRAGGGPVMGGLRRVTATPVALAISAITLVVWRLVADPVIYGSLPAVGLAPLLVLGGAAVWVPIAGPWPDLRPRVPERLVLLVGLALELTVLGMWTAAGEPAGRRPSGIWDIGPETDIRLAGLVIVVGVLVPLAVGAVLLVGWVRDGGPARERSVVVAGRRSLTAGDVVAEFDRLGPPRHVEGRDLHGPDET